MNEMASIFKIAMGEVARGRDSAIKLAIVLGHELLPPPTGDQVLSSAAKALVDELVGSLSKALVALGAASTKAEACRSPTGKSNISTCDEWGDQKNKSHPAGREAYRRRAHPYNWTTKTSKTMEDGYTWRKYGQKEIYGAKYQRSYFRCTHKHDQGCKATRQVQKSEEDPSVYLITYMGEHTCRSGMNGGALASINIPNLISFGFDACGNGSQGSSPVSAITTSLPSLKQEADGEVVSSRAPGCSSWEHDHFDIKPQLGWAAGDAVEYYGDMTSLFHSSANRSEMDVTEESFDVDELLNLDHQDEFYYI